LLRLAVSVDVGLAFTAAFYFMPALFFNVNAHQALASMLTNPTIKTLVAPGRWLAEHKMVDVIVTTAGGIEEDFIKCMGHTYMGDFALKGEPNKAGIAGRRLLAVLCWCG
jgi:hypothetical protein